jgi:lipopolysaccharide biosynthesis regulator YciM
MPPRQVCNVDKAKADFETVLRLKPDHKTATSELAATLDLAAALASLADSEGAGAGAAALRPSLDKVLGAAPDCPRAQLAEARLEMEAGNYEQVRGGGGEVGGGGQL